MAHPAYSFNAVASKECWSSVDLVLFLHWDSISIKNYSVFPQCTQFSSQYCSNSSPEYNKKRQMKCNCIRKNLDKKLPLITKFHIIRGQQMKRAINFYPRRNSMEMRCKCLRLNNHLPAVKIMPTRCSRRLKCQLYWQIKGFNVKLAQR